jgi:pilus assembly protein Flp/PilA
MSAQIRRLVRFLSEENAATAVEYAVMLALIIVGCITIVSNLGRTASSTFNKKNATLSSQRGGSGMRGSRTCAGIWAFRHGLG